jgi:hypothetical protein
MVVNEAEGNLLPVRNVTDIRPKDRSVGESDLLTENLLVGLPDHEFSLIRRGTDDLDCIAVIEGKFPDNLFVHVSLSFHMGYLCRL